MGEAASVLAAVAGRESTPMPAIGSSPSSGQRGECCPLPGAWATLSPGLPSGGRDHQLRCSPPPPASRPAPSGLALHREAQQRDQPCHCAVDLGMAAVASFILSSAGFRPPPLLPRALFLLEEQVGTLALALPPPCLLECSAQQPQEARACLRLWGTGHPYGMPAPRGQALTSSWLCTQHPGSTWH